MVLLTGAHSLQDLGDLRQLSSMSPILLVFFEEEEELTCRLEEALDHVEREIMNLAQQHKVNGRFRDAEYLFRRIFSPQSIPMAIVDPYQSDDVFLTLRSIYEGLGDYPSAEMTQERLLGRLFARNAEHNNDEQTQAVHDYSRLLSLFQKRILELNDRYLELQPACLELLITYRAALLDIIPLNSLLVENGLVPVEAKPGCHGTSLHIAAQRNALNLATLLLKNGANIASRDLRESTPLHKAVEYRNPQMVELLLANGADVKAVDVSGETPLHLAIYESNLTTMTYLIKEGADPNALNFFDSMPLDIAIEYDNSAAVKLLLDHGANVEDDFDHTTYTVLHVAVMYKRRDIILILIRHIAPYKLPLLCQKRTCFGATPLDMARIRAEYADESSVEKSILYMLENALELSSSYG